MVQYITSKIRSIHTTLKQARIEILLQKIISCHRLSHLHPRKTFSLSFLKYVVRFGFYELYPPGYVALLGYKKRQNGKCLNLNLDKQNWSILIFIGLLHQKSSGKMNFIHFYHSFNPSQYLIIHTSWLFRHQNTILRWFKLWHHYSFKFFQLKMGLHINANAFLAF